MNTVTNGSGLTTLDKNIDWQMELLMEKLRSKASQFKSFQETAKTVRMTMLDKRYALDSVEKSQHQKCLDTLQHCIKVTSLQSMVERLESLTRQLGYNISSIYKLKFMVGPSGVELFISSDMFYLEIILDQSGAVKDVKVHHEGKMEQQSCAELVSCLTKQDFADFTVQLEGFASIYQLNAEKKVKCKAFTALQSLETDLNTLAQLQTFMKEPFNLLHKSPVGILEKRRGGHPMKLTYFVSPYDLLDVEKGDLDPMTVETITLKNLGYKVTVCMEGSAAHKLQTTTLITVNRSINGKNTPAFATLSSQNSAVIPACFVLRLNKPMPMCVALVKQIQQVTELECAELTTTHPMLSLIVSHASSGKLETGSSRGLFVTLPDQQHCYFTTENKNMEGILVHNIPFTHPGHVSQILVILRQQALFNTIITSCVRPASKQDFDNMIMFEINALSWTHISISLEHPIEETMATAELDLSEISNLQCRVHSPSSPPPQNVPDIASELATKVLNRCFSIPITMRSIIKLWDKQVIKKNYFNGHENFSLPLGSGDPGGHRGPPSSGLSEFGGLEGKMKQDNMHNGGLPHGMNLSLMAHQNQGMFLNESMIASANFTNFPVADTSTSSLLTSMDLTSIVGSNTTQQQERPKRSKRKGSDDIWRGTKRKLGEENELLLETSSSDSTSRSTPLSQETASEVGIATPNSVVGFQSDIEFSTIDSAELIESTGKSTEFDNIDDLADMEEILTSNSSECRTRKTRDIQKSPNTEAMENKSVVTPSVSITPINTSGTAGFSSPTSNSERRPGIEIIPLATTTPPTTLSSSITITAIPSSHIKAAEEKSRDKKSSRNRSDDKSRIEKKRKRKREESPMGPPEKIPSKQDPLSKPVSVSIKPAESPPLPSSATPTSPSSMMRKFSASPTQNKHYSVSGKLSPSMMKSSLKSGSSHQSPKHSPAHVPNSPKLSIPGISSPKSHGTSPKHPSTGSSGKPSMSTLKSAANSPSSKSSSDMKIKSSGKDSPRDKDKKSLSVSSSNKIKSSSVKLKQLDLSSASDSGGQGDGLPSPSGSVDLSKSANSNQVRNRKGSLSAVIDKLKLAQHCDNATDLSGKTSSNRERTSQATSKMPESSKNASKVGGENKNSEYMVKPSSDGMKITINKTRTKDSSKSSSSSLIKSQSSTSTSSPKTHTGLKPGVNSGPASKKPQQLAQKSSSSPNITSSGYSKSTNSGSCSKTQSSSQKSCSTGGSANSKIIPKLSGSPKTCSSVSSKDRPRLNKSSSDKSIFSSSRDRKGSPTQNRDENDTEKSFKLALSKMDPYSTSPLMVEGLIKQLDKNFQIPKLSARNSEDKKQANKSNTNATSDNVNNVNRTVVASNVYDIISKSEMPLSKYPLATIPTGKIVDTNVEAKIRNTTITTVSNANNPISLITSIASPKSNIPNSQIKDSGLNTVEVGADICEEKRKECNQGGNVNSNNASGGKDDASFKLNYPISATKTYFSNASLTEPLSLSTKSVDLTSKFVTPLVKDDKKDPKAIIKDTIDNLLDFSGSNKSDIGKIVGNSGIPLGPPPPFPASPSVSVHIVKSPAPSPLINPSPHSASPCITDDELMDEALVGLGK